MTTPWEIRSSAKKVYQLTQDVRREMQSVRKEINASTTYWQGTSATTFISEQNTTLNQLERLIRSLDGVENGLNKLANEVQRADQEREAKRRLEEQMRLEKQGKK